MASFVINSCIKLNNSQSKLTEKNNHGRPASRNPFSRDGGTFGSVPVVGAGILGFGKREGRDGGNGFDVCGAGEPVVSLRYTASEIMDSETVGRGWSWGRRGTKT